MSENLDFLLGTLEEISRGPAVIWLGARESSEAASSRPATAKASKVRGTRRPPCAALIVAESGGGFASLWSGSSGGECWGRGPLLVVLVRSALAVVLLLCIVRCFLSDRAATSRNSAPTKTKASILAPSQLLFKMLCFVYLSVLASEYARIHEPLKPQVSIFP